MKIRPILSLLSFLFVAQLSAAEPNALHAARADFEKAGSPPTEAARVQYLTKLVSLRADLAHRNDLGWKAVDAEISRHPVPKNSDAKALTALLVGKWSSPRHDYLYRKNGTWTMLPAEEDATRGDWHVEGNRFVSSGVDDKRRPYTILLLTKKDFVFTDGEVVFYETRLTK